MNSLIVFEGCDCSGKTDIGNIIAKMLGYRFEHEPTFDSSFADQLNFRKLDSYQREFYFMKDRIQHQEILNANNICLDRYVLSGIAYANYFSPQVLDMVKSIYSMHTEFKRPDFQFYVDMNPDVAVQINESRKDTEDYNPKLKKETLVGLRDSFMNAIDIMGEWGVETMIVQNEFGKKDQTVERIVNKINDLGL